MLIPPSTAQGDRLLEYLDFLRLQAIAARDKEFLSSHTEDWYHGMPAPYTLVKYAPFEQFNRANFRQMNSEVYLSPYVNLEKVALPHVNSRSSSVSELLKRPERTLEFSDSYKRDWDASSFSGYFQLPNFSYSRLQPTKELEEGTGQFCYQTHYDVENLTVMFGGLVVDAKQSLRNLGIPRLTDLSRISVHFPYDLPPHINKHVLMSPCVTQNKDMILFDPMKGTVQANPIDMCSDVTPSQVCAMEGTMISASHVFYGGGFIVDVDKVEYKDEFNRWLVYKSIRLNEHGFILDVRTKQFTKIKIKSNSEVNYNGAIGHALVSNRVERTSLRNSLLMLPEMPAAYNSEISQDAPPLAEDILSPHRVRTPVSSPEHVPLKAPQPSSNQPPYQPSQDFRKQSSLGRSRSMTPTSNRPTSRQNTDQQVMPGKFAGRTSESRFQNGAFPPNSSSSESSLKMTSMLMKSARIFHRNHHNQAFGQSHGSQGLSGSSNQTQAHNLASLRGSSPSPNPQSTYANQVKQHRAHAPLSGASTPSTSPARRMTQSPVNNPSALTVGSIDSVSDEASVLSETSGPVEKLKVDTAAFTVERQRSVDRTTSPDGATSLGSGLTGDGLLTGKDSAIESGVLSVTVYLFGGFVKYVDENNRSSFKATNDLLRLELIIEDGQSGKFHKEALIFDTTDHNEDVIWPTRRGFFAFVLVNTEPNSELCRIADSSDLVADEPSKSHIFSSESTQEVLSTNEKSSGSSTQTTENFLKKRSLMIQGGVDENNHVCSDIYIFNFAKGKWHRQQSYAYDYYGEPKQPYEDEVTEKLTLEAASCDAPLVEAELRACHHHALLYEQDNKEYVLFVGGFVNDYLRHFDPEPYTSDRYDVSRLSRFSITTTNPNLLRVPALNLRTQTWVFMRFFFDLRDSISSRTMDLLMGNPNFRNSRMAFYGGGCSITGKQITLCHGMVEFVSEKAENFANYKEELKSDVIMSGCHCHLSYPSM